MKRILMATVLVCAVVTPSFAARVYLKDGGYINARKVWRTPGKVHVLVNRDTLTEFSPAEIDLRRTFKPGNRRPPRKPAAAQAPASSNGAAATTLSKEKPGVSLSLPSTPDGKASEGQGSIRKHKGNMQQRANE